ncbi:MAG TPA: hypothetical protein VMA34_00075 [Terracidiphilus sp.]|nr:hypothetical protein [Terracidiphilus sp.]
MTTVRAGLDRLAARQGPLAPPQPATGASTIEPPHAVYDLRADEISNGGGLESAHLTAFRYLIKSAGAAVAAAEVSANIPGNASLLANVNYGPYVAASAQALDELSAPATMLVGSYEARLLRFSAIYLVALWLKADPGGSDVVVPLAPAPGSIQAGRRYTVPEFLDAITPLARNRTQKTSGDPLP